MCSSDLFPSHDTSATSTLTSTPSTPYPTQSHMPLLTLLSQPLISITLLDPFTKSIVSPLIHLLLPLLILFFKLILRTVHTIERDRTCPCIAIRDTYATAFPLTAKILHSMMPMREDAFLVGSPVVMLLFRLPRSPAHPSDSPLS